VRDDDRRPAGHQLRRSGEGDVVVPDRPRGGDQLRVHRHDHRGAAGHRRGGAAGDLAAERHPADHHRGGRVDGM
ncbi:MAG: hypothetical protein AVDCRST_MAG41-3175, partial [uncultured Corynebacteriales bacterium]